MKLKMYFLGLALGAFSLALQSCDDDNDSIPVSDELRQALADRHGDAQRVEWETRGGYYVADFNEDNYEKEAWFDANGTWQMTETDIPGLAALPAAVRTAFESSRYATWRVDDIDKLERNGLEPVYVIEVEQGNQEVDLYYSEGGLLIKEVAEGGTGGSAGGGSSEGYLPSGLPAAVKAFIDENYPNARLVETDVEHGLLEVDIIHDNRAKELLFTSANEWISTSWDVYVQSLPQAVTAAVQGQYSGFRIDDAEYVQTPTGDYYLLELERGEAEFDIRIAADGTILQ